MTPRSTDVSFEFFPPNTPEGRRMNRRVTVTCQP
jgi:outer membrane protein OmpA-like peptidoglycan-associated protein